MSPRVPDVIRHVQSLPPRSSLSDCGERRSHLGVLRKHRLIRGSGSSPGRWSLCDPTHAAGPRATLRAVTQCEPLCWRPIVRWVFVSLDILHLTRCFFLFLSILFPRRAVHLHRGEVKKEMLELWYGYQVNPCGDLHLNCPSAWRPDLCPHGCAPLWTPAGGSGRQGLSPLGLQSAWTLNRAQVFVTQRSPDVRVSD